MSELYRAKWYATQQEMIADLDRHIAEQDREITALQIAKDNLELRLESELCNLSTETIMEFTNNGPAQVY